MNNAFFSDSRRGVSNSYILAYILIAGLNYKHDYTRLYSLDSAAPSEHSMRKNATSPGNSTFSNSDPSTPP
jgi:hypothetical protein